MKKNTHLAGAFTLAAVVLSACGGGGGSSGSAPPPTSSTYTATSGVAQKGPLILGSTVTAQELSPTLAPTGKQYSYQTNTDFGTFTPNSTFTSRYIGLNATGYYFDEVVNSVSTGPITLNGYSDLSAVSVLNVNLLTTLTYQRIENLVTKSNMTFAAAQSQAEGEVLAAFHIPNARYGSFDSLDLSKGTDGDNILAAISSIFIYGNTAGNLSALLANVQNDIGANGAITSQTTAAALVASAKALNPANIAANLTQKYASTGITFNATAISDWIDQDGDGLVSKFKFQVPDATQTTTFTFPAFVVTDNAGRSVSVSGGLLSVNGAPVSGSVTIQAGDTVVASPPAATFPNGVFTAYLVSGTTKLARVSFVSNLQSIAVTPASHGLPLGLTQQFVATGTFSDGGLQDLTKSVTWASSYPAIATIAATTGLASALSGGATTITATSGSISGSATLTVTPAALESIAVTPNPVVLGAGVSRQLTATGTYSDGSTADLTGSATWTSSAPTVASVNSTTGLATGAAIGPATLTATSGTVAGTVPVSVTANTWVLVGGTAYYGAISTLLQDGRVLACGGGANFPGAIRQCDLYNPKANSWSPTGSLETARWGLTVTTLQNGKVLAAGGACQFCGGALTVAELFDPTTQTWSPAASMTTGRAWAVATLLASGKVLVVGGSTNSTELYDPTSNTWSSAGSLPFAAYYQSTTLLASGKVLVVGGGSPLGAEIYDPTTNSWAAAASPTYARSNHTATLLPSGKVLVAGGIVAGVATATAEIYDPIADAWSPAASLMTARYYHSATLLPSGKVLVVDGWAAPNNTDTTSTELYDPAANTWTPAASTLLPHSQQTAILLLDGELLISGGDDNSAEIYW